MQLSKIHAPLLAASILAALSGCSENKGHAGRDGFTPDYDAPAPGTYSGQVMNGYLRNAVVWIDLDNDRIQDPDEPYTLTGSEGRFTFTREDLRCGDEADLEQAPEDASADESEVPALECISRPKAYPLGVKVIAGNAVDEFTRTAVTESFYLWAPPIPHHVNRLVTPFTTLIKAERDQQAFTGLTQAYPVYEPPTEAELIAELDQHHDAVRKKLGVTANLLGDYITANNARLHAYARGVVRAMQEYIRNNGGTLDAMEVDGSADIQAELLRIYEASLNDGIAAHRMAAITGLAVADIEAILKDNDETPEAKAAALAAMVNPVQPRLDALARALVNQGRWILTAIDEAAGSQPTASTFNSLDLDEIVPQVYVLEDDPRMLFRKKLYVHPSSAVGSSALESTFMVLENTSSHKEGAALTQVQTYLYDPEHYHLAQIDVHGDLHEWRRDLLVSYPVPLEAMFPLGFWQASRLDLDALGAPSTRVQIGLSSGGNPQDFRISVEHADEGEFEGTADEPEWQQTRVLLTTSEEVEHFLEIALQSQSWLKSWSKRNLGGVGEVTAEQYPVVPTALEAIAPSLYAPTAHPSNIRLSHQPSEHEGRIDRLDFSPQGTGVMNRWRTYGSSTGSNRKVEYRYESSSGSEKLAEGELSYNSFGLPERATFNFDWAEDAPLTRLQSYCINYQYDEHSDLQYEIYQRMDSSNRCGSRLPVMLVEYEYRHLSELLKR